jgi:hypothetical protein
MNILVYILLLLSITGMLYAPSMRNEKRSVGLSLMSFVLFLVCFHFALTLK